MLVRMLCAVAMYWFLDFSGVAAETPLNFGCVLPYLCNVFTQKMQYLTNATPRPSVTQIQRGGITPYKLHSLPPSHTSSATPAMVAEVFQVPISPFRQLYEDSKGPSLVVCLPPTGCKMVVGERFPKIICRFMTLRITPQR